MDYGYRKPLIWTLISSLIVLVGVGHGIAPIILTELLIFKDFKFQFTFDENPLAVVRTASLLFIVGQICLLFYLSKKKPFLFWLGNAILWSGFCILIWGEGGVILIFGLPFAIISSITIGKFVIAIRGGYEEERGQ